MQRFPPGCGTKNEYSKGTRQMRLSRISGSIGVMEMIDDTDFDALDVTLSFIGGILD